jgi:hypothetical protein
MESRLGGVVVSVLDTGPKGYGFEPGQGDGFSKILSTPSFQMDVKPEVPCLKILRHVKERFEVPRGRTDLANGSIETETKNSNENLPQCHFVYHKSLKD